MRIYDYAKEKEKDKIRFFVHQSKIATARGFKNVMKVLAIEEFDQYLAIKKLRQSYPSLNIEMPNNEEPLEIQKMSVDLSEFQAYEKIEEVEEASKEDYLEKAKAASDKDQKKILLHLAKKEEEHFNAIRGIVEFLIEPRCFLENAEFYHDSDNP